MEATVINKPRGGNPAWVKGGESPNPLGAGSPTRRLKERFDYWLHSKTAGEIEAIVNNKSEWNKLPGIDGMLARRIYGAISDNGDGAKDFSLIMEYAYGKPKSGDDVASIAAAVVGAATTSIMNALSDKLLGAIAPEPATIEQSATTSMEKK